MMGIPPSEFKELSWWEYQAVLHTWNERHKVDGEEEVEAPDAAFVDKIFERLAEAGLVSVH